MDAHLTKPGGELPGVRGLHREALGSFRFVLCDVLEGGGDPIFGAGHATGCGPDPGEYLIQAWRHLPSLRGLCSAAHSVLLMTCHIACAARRYGG
jgi:hypothetical protein